MKEINTLCDLYFHNVDELPRSDLLRIKRNGQWRTTSTAEVKKYVEELSCALMTMGVKPGDKVAIISEDRPEWLICDYAILTAGAVTVPLYSTLNAQASAYIVNDSDAEVAIVSNQDHANKLLSQKASLPRLRDIVVMEMPGGKVENLLSWEQVMEWGRDFASKNPGIHRKVAEAVKRDDLATIIYTSGTTGNPKGVMLEHKSFVENCRAGFEYLDIDQRDSAFVFLPLSHSFERMIDYCYFWKGLSMTYVSSMDNLLEDLKDASPVLMAAVPRVFEKIYAGVMEKASIASKMKKNLVHWSLKVASDWAEAFKKGDVSGYLSLKHKIADHLVLKKIRGLLGGNLRFTVSGGAPLPRHLAVLFYGCGVPIVEGYGLTETAPVISVNVFKKSEERIRFGSTGLPLTNVEVRIEEDGELSVRGPNVMRGYYKNPEATAEVLGEDGWFATGDIARLDEDGFLYITDRKKDLIVTAGGKNVAPQPIENEIMRNKYVSQAILIGDRRPYITALIIPNWDNVIEYAKSKGLDLVDPEHLKGHPVVLHLFDMVKERINAGLSRYEQVKRFGILTRELTQESGELTPTLKVKRRVINEKYKDLIESLYSAEGHGKEARTN